MNGENSLSKSPTKMYGTTLICTKHNLWHFFMDSCLSFSEFEINLTFHANLKKNQKKSADFDRKILIFNWAISLSEFEINLLN
jgi:hypothetical protein